MADIVQPFDLQRMFFGEQPSLFYLEIVVRTAIVYAYGLLLLRWLGSRTIGQLSTVEFLLVIALGSAIGDPMFYPDVPLFHALGVMTLVVVANRGLDMLIARSRKAGDILEGKPKEAIEAGVFCKSFIRRDLLGHSEIFQQLRHHGISQLGQVRHAYIEPDGELTVFRARKEQPGLPIVPPWEVREPERLEHDRPLEHAALLACRNCGQTSPVPAATSPGQCPHCDHQTWTYAVGESGAKAEG